MNVYLIGIIISFVVYLIIGFIISRRVKNANDFYVAGRNAPVFLIVGSMIASYASTGMFMGDAGEYYSGMFSPMTIQTTMQIAGYVIGAVFFGRYLRRSQVYTIPEFFGRRFCSSGMHKLATVTAIIMMTVYLLSVMQGIGTLMSLLTGLDYQVCVILSMITFALVSIFSGASGVLITDTIMFGMFTASLVVSVFIIANAGGGWYATVEQVCALDVDGLLAWHGNRNYLYDTGLEYMIWGLIYGIVWMSVCMVGPWQSSRYIMAKNEHTVIRSSVFSAFGIFLLQLLVGMGSVAINIYNPGMETPTHVLIWAAQNMLPTVLGVVLLTGIMAAGISSATTFLSLIGSSVANDIFGGKGKSIQIGKFAMAITCMVVIILDNYVATQIFWILYFGGSIVAASWMPVALASIFSKRVTKTGAFCGMLFGFLGCFATKLYSAFSGVTLPVYMDPTVVGMVLNTIAIVIGSALTKVTPEEIQAREALFVMPESEKDPAECQKTVRYMKLAPVLGAMVLGVLLVLWVIPFWRATA